MIRLYRPSTEVIVNADDFGASQKINDCIGDCIRAGVVTSTTVMVNMPFAGQINQLASAHPELTIGLHANLTEGRPVLSPALVPTLVGTNGEFVGFRRLRRRVLLGGVNDTELAAELEAQMQKLVSFGITISHVDSHQHTHVWPAVSGALASVAAKAGVLRMRSNRRLFSSYDGSSALLPASTSHFIRHPASVLGLLLKASQARAAKAQSVRTPDYLLSPVPNIRTVPREDAVRRWHSLIAKLPSLLFEVNCHPGLFEGEHELFSSPEFRTNVTASGARLVGYDAV